MPTLLLTLSGPLQAWGSGSRFATRQTESAPTKSGVLGLLAAAQGIRRTEPLTELSGLRFGVRIDQPGRLVRDFQTARSLDGSNAMPLSHRYFLGDAVFLAALESTDGEFLSRILGHLRRPVFPLYLGRRACPPAGPIPAEIVDASIDEAFERAPWKAAATHREQYRYVPYAEVETRIDAGEGTQGAERLRDVPVSFDPAQRAHTWREIEVGRVWLPNPDFRAAEGQTPGDSVRGASVDEASDRSIDFHDVFAAFPQGD